MNRRGLLRLLGLAPVAAPAALAAAARPPVAHVGATGEIDGQTGSFVLSGDRLINGTAGSVVFTVYRPDGTILYRSRALTHHAA